MTGLADAETAAERIVERRAPPVRVILSRKGFDSQAGGGPSPILPDGRMVSLPIPDKDGTVRYADIRWGERTLLDLLHQLGYTHIGLQTPAHLDPDLVAARCPRASAWTGLFGQAAASATHLANQGVGPDDIFLFWGLFRHTEKQEGRLCFVGRPFHAIFGYLEVAEVLATGAGATVPWAPEFPHFQPRYQDTNCLVYVARRCLSGTDLPGFGTFRYSEALRLSVPAGRGVTDWQLPACFYPASGAVLSYHGSPERWTEPCAGMTRLRVVARGQEFVAAPNREICAWARALIAGAERA
jgi:Nucleotide modification associated domain 3